MISGVFVFVFVKLMVCMLAIYVEGVAARIETT
jgi:hypothetical protein